MRFGRIITLPCVLALAGFGLAACGEEEQSGQQGQPGGQSGQPPQRLNRLTVGNLVPVTGDLSVFGPAGRKAATLAARQAQAAGVQVNLVTADTQTQPQAAVSAARQLASQGASCLAGAWASANTIPVGESVASRQRIPLVSPASTSAEISELDDNGFVNRVAPSDNLQADALAQVIRQELGEGATVSLAARNDAYGEGFILKLRDALRERGLQPVGPVLYDPEQASYNSEAGEIVANNPDGYAIIDFPETYAKLGAALQRTGQFDASKLFVADGLASDSIPEGVPAEALRGARGTRPGTPETGAAAEAFDRLWRQGGNPRQRQTFDSQNFDAVTLCTLAAVAAGSDEGTAIKDELQAVSAPPGRQFTFEQLPQAIQALQRGEEIDYEGASGPINLDEKGDPTAATYEVYRYQPNGDLEVQRQFQAGDLPGAEPGGGEQAPGTPEPVE